MGASACVQGAASPIGAGAVEAVSIDSHTIKVYWDAAPGAMAYAVLRDGKRIEELGANATAYTDSGLEQGSTHKYDVLALASDGSETPSEHPYTERCAEQLADSQKCQVLVVGATTAGVAAAVTAARYGLNVDLIEESGRLGGMPANGLGASDIRRASDSSGFFEEYRRTVQQIYGAGDGISYEPRVAQQAMKQLLFARANVHVYMHVRPVRVIMAGSRIKAVEAELVPTGSRCTFDPQIVIDATDCGDVAAGAGAPFTVGREGRSKREPHAGHIYYDRKSDKALPGSTGRADKRVQAYAYLMVVKDFGPGTDHTIAEPPGFNAHDFEHAPEFSGSWAVTDGELPHHEYEVNQHPEGADLQGINYRYPTASYAERRRIEHLYKTRALQYLYYIQNVEGHRNIGLSIDDYRASDGWPELLYIREARRFLARERLDETDIRDARLGARGDSIGVGDYPMDSHAAEPKTNWNSADMGEGEFYLPQYTPWHQVPYSIMVPLKVDNVFVPTAVSATHVAYGTVRLEPIRMFFGEAAGIASWLCIRYKETPAEVPVRQIQMELLKPGDAFTSSEALDGVGAPAAGPTPPFLYLFADVPAEHPLAFPIQWLAARGFYPCPAPALRTASSGLTAQAFRPDDPLTGDEAHRLLVFLWRRMQQDRTWPLPQAPADAPLARIPAGFLPSGSAPVTRIECARIISQLMGFKPEGSTVHYSDLPAASPDSQAAEGLFANWIDSELWDGIASSGPGHLLLFKPKLPITRAQFAQLLFLMQMHSGPLWQDHPSDRVGQR